MWLGERGVTIYYQCELPYDVRRGLASRTAQRETVLAADRNTRGRARERRVSHRVGGNVGLPRQLTLS